MKYTLLELIGLASIGTVSWFVLRGVWKFLYSTFIGHALGHSLSLKNIGQWAVVTGATDGIGRAYAEELASHGLNIVLISRSPYKLQNVAAEIESQYKVKTKIIDVDFTNGIEIYDRIKKEIEGLEIGVLINNVGMSYAYPEYLAEVPNAAEFSLSLINCNVVSVTQMCILVLGQMVERKKGLILNVSSASAVLPTPLMTMYSSTKAYVYKFSEDLALEYAPLGIKIQCVLPGFVVSKMSRYKKPAFRIPLPRDFVRGHMRSLGLEFASAGFWVHKILLGYYTKLNMISPSTVVNVTFANLNGTRQRALKRIQLQQEQQKQENGVENGVENAKDK
ncbi:hypothetical protein OUZ56_022009 [Daphnia magna]|uniref:Estradiol 17-beta-dehydrogenase 12 n=1 Tax=Daphnia magna TaxID=35525 RepID=A0ABR0AV28_9CRUS|nr:hypothetical protein OUZ56_022009 [Daphnia magna]